MQTLKTLLKYAAIPFVLLGAVVYGLIMKVNRLQGEASLKEAERGIADVLSKKEEASRDADGAVAEFRAALASERRDDDT